MLLTTNARFLQFQQLMECTSCTVTAGSISNLEFVLVFHSALASTVFELRVWDRHIDGQTDRQTDRQTEEIAASLNFPHFGVSLSQGKKFNLAWTIVCPPLYRMSNYWNFTISFQSCCVCSSLSPHAVNCGRFCFWRRQSFVSLLLWSPYVIGQTIIFSSCNFYLLLLFFSPNLSGRKLDVYHTLTHGVTLVRI